MKGKGPVIWFVVIAALPALFLTVLVFGTSGIPISADGLLLLYYLLTGVAMVAFFLLRPCNLFALPLGFLLSFLPLLIYEYAVAGWYQYLVTFAVVVFYSAPCALVSLIVASIMTVHRKLSGNRKQEIDIQAPSKPAENG